MRRKQNGRGKKKEKETEGGRRGTAAIVRCLIVLMGFKALAGKQMLFCEMDSIFLPPNLIFCQAAAGHSKSSPQKRRIAGGAIDVDSI